VLAGFGFEGFTEDGKARGWNGVSNMDILGFEFAQSFRESSRAWNKGTQNWLERYVYTRTGNSLMATYFISAFWHGFYPGYYFFFMSRTCCRWLICMGWISSSLGYCGAWNSTARDVGEPPRVQAHPPSLPREGRVVWRQEEGLRLAQLCFRAARHALLRYALPGMRHSVCW
jgi:hypothetical protein